MSQEMERPQLVKVDWVAVDKMFEYIGAAPKPGPDRDSIEMLLNLVAFWITGPSIEPSEFSINIDFRTKVQADHSLTPQWSINFAGEDGYSEGTNGWVDGDLAQVMTNKYVSG